MEPKLNSISHFVSTAATNYISQSKVPNHVIMSSLPQEDAEALRAAYLEIIELADWDQKFATEASLIVENLKKDQPVYPIVNTTFCVATDNQLYEFDSTNNKYIMVGRKPGCQVLFTHDGTSRMHAMIFPLPELNMILVVDMGSLTGIMTVKRSQQNKQCVNSLANNRNVLIFDWNEVAILKMGSVQVGINTKECIICMTNPRNVIFGCNHSVACADCSQKLTDCPICRAHIGNKVPGFALKSNAIN